MKLSGKIIVYMMLTLVMFFVSACCGGAARWLAGILCGGIFIGGSIYSSIRVRQIEKGAALLPDIEAFRNNFDSVNEKTFRILVDGVERQKTEVEEKYSVKVMNRQSKIDSLQSQINPHFLYNTLECIRSEALLQKCDSIASMAKSLASFFRYSISRKENMVPILDELNNIKNYFLIQNYRFENKFNFEVEIEEDSRRYYSWLIPKMTIQPIVENAIFHGLETKTGDCYVKVHIASTQDKVILTVSDNGIGMDEPTLEELKCRMEQGEVQEKRESAHGNGIALYNVNQRIKLIFGNQYGLQAYSTEGIGTDIEIIIPIVTETM